MQTVQYTRPWLYPLQEQAIFYPRDAQGNIARFSYIEAGTKTGKTVGCIVWLHEQALMAERRFQNYWWVAPVRKQAEIAFWRMLRMMPSGWFDVNVSDLKLTVKLTQSIIWFKSAEIPDNLYGEDVYAAVYDEASRGREESWIALDSTLTKTQGPVRFIGNVKGRKNWFYRDSRKAEAGEPDCAYFKITAWDAVKAGVLVDKAIESARRRMSEAAFKELFLAEAADDAGNPFGLDNIRACVAPLSGDRPVAFGIDLAKSHDWTCIIGLDSKGRTSVFKRYQRPWAETIQDIKQTIGGTKTLVDSTGVGDPIVELLQRDIGSHVEGYLFSMASKQKLMEGLTVSIHGRKISYPDGVIPNELESFEYTYTKTGVRYKAIEGAHDDTVCALALADYHKLTNPGMVGISDAVLARSRMPATYRRMH